MEFFSYIICIVNILQKIMWNFTQETFDTN
jgi:hypothetical protein